MKLITRIFTAIDKVDEEVRLTIVEEALKGKETSIPIKALEDHFLDGVKTFLWKLECTFTKPLPITVAFQENLEEEKINMETDACSYLTTKGIRYIAWGKGNLAITAEGIFLTLAVSWDDSYVE